MIYVDSQQNPYGRMKMSHMMADTSEELLAMAVKIGVNPKWIQDKGEPGEHFDICMARRDAAIKAGAKIVSSRELIKIVRERRNATPSSPPRENQE